MENKDIEQLQKNKKRSCTLMYMIAVITIFAGGLYVGKNLACKELEILYISQAEILSLEKKRASDVSDDQLFFGKPNDAIKHIETLQKEMNKKGQYILLTDSKIYGSNARSISKQIHQLIVERLGVQ